MQNKQGFLPMSFSMTDGKEETFLLCYSWHRGNRFSLFPHEREKCLGAQSCHGTASMRESPSSICVSTLYQGWEKSNRSCKRVDRTCFCDSSFSFTFVVNLSVLRANWILPRFAWAFLSLEWTTTTAHRVDLWPRSTRMSFIRSEAVTLCCLKLDWIFLLANLLI